jgi:hypothetical protein
MFEVSTSSTVSTGMLADTVSPPDTLMLAVPPISAAYTVVSDAGSDGLVTATDAAITIASNRITCFFFIIGSPFVPVFLTDDVL